MSLNLSKKRQYTRPYVGITTEGTREVFRLAFKPSEELFVSKYFAVIGPFKTRRGAEFMAKYGAGNPHLVTVADAEKAARQEVVAG